MANDIEAAARALVAKADAMAREYGPGMLHGYCGDEIAALRAALARPAVASNIEAAAREAFVAHMASIGVTDVVWTAEVGPVGYRDNHNAMLSVEWERFDAGYRAALARPAADDAGAMREAAARRFEHLAHVWNADPKMTAETVAAIRALPLPAAPATAVEEARRNLMMCVRETVDGSLDAEELGIALARFDAAEAAAKESRSDDRPASGQGGV